jgi:hypothetical protein
MMGWLMAFTDHDGIMSGFGYCLVLSCLYVHENDGPGVHVVFLLLVSILSRLLIEMHESLGLGSIFLL